MALPLFPPGEPSFPRPPPIFTAAPHSFGYGPSSFPISTTVPPSLPFLSSSVIPPVSSSLAPPIPPLNAIPHSQIRPPKLNLLPFDGSDPLDWLFQADQYFMFYQVPWDQRVPIVAFYMQGAALSWFKWMFHNNQLGDWTSFARALEIRFGPSSYENHQGELLKLRQTGSVTDFQVNFEKLSNRVFGIPPEVLKNCFISGLLPEIQNEIALFQPQTISQAIGLAKLIEAKLKDAKPKFNRSSSSFQYPPSPPPKSANPIPKPTTTKEPQSLPVKRMTSQQLQERRAAGLCYNCGEKFHPGHKCATPQFLLLLSQDDSELELPATNAVLDAPNLADFEPNPAVHFQLSTKAPNNRGLLEKQF
uniref:Retrotransposon gag domain-containing protein n=1 Tax=Cajanus cajan TaxID=3821 RepID=A0A151SZN5_CAJCA|nr:hypothetical protein KK1_015727 [Cajanus cajan]